MPGTCPLLLLVRIALPTRLMQPSAEVCPCFGVILENRLSSCSFGFVFCQKFSTAHECSIIADRLVYVTCACDLFLVLTSGSHYLGATNQVKTHNITLTLVRFLARFWQWLFPTHCYYSGDTTWVHMSVYTDSISRVKSAL